MSRPQAAAQRWLPLLQDLTLLQCAAVPACRRGDDLVVLAHKTKPEETRKH
jgi:hypothetical protein